MNFIIFFLCVIFGNTLGQLSVDLYYRYKIRKELDMKMLDESMKLEEQMKGEAE